MWVELHENDEQFLIKLLEKTHLKDLIKNIEKATPHPDCDEFIVFELSVHEAEELVGQLSFEANHTRSNNKFERACAIADSIETHLFNYKRAE